MSGHDAPDWTNTDGMQEVFDFYFFQIIMTPELIKPERKISAP